MSRTLPADVVVRRIGEADHAALGVEVERARRAGEFAASSDATGAFFMKALAFAPSPIAAAVTERGEVLGFLSPEFKVIAVRPDRRRQGIGTALVEEGVRIEQERERPNVLIGVLADDLPGQGFLRATEFDYHSTLWTLDIAPEHEVVAPAWPAEVEARAFDKTRDLGDWVTLFNRAFADHATPLQLDLAALEAAPEEPDRPDDDVLVVAERATGELIGFCATEPERVDGVVGEHGEIWTIGVRPDWQGRGLGRQLLRWGVLRLRDVGTSRIQLSVNGRNEGALGLYESEGFQRIETRDRWARPVR